MAVSGFSRSPTMMGEDNLIVVMLLSQDIARQGDCCACTKEIVFTILVNPLLIPFSVIRLCFCRLLFLLQEWRIHMVGIQYW